MIMFLGGPHFRATQVSSLGGSGASTGRVWFVQFRATHQLFIGLILVDKTACPEARMS